MATKEALTATVEKACARRNKARKLQKYAVADELRDMLTDLGVVIQDTGPSSSTWQWTKAADFAAPAAKVKAPPKAAPATAAAAPAGDEDASDSESDSEAEAEAAEAIAKDQARDESLALVRKRAAAGEAEAREAKAAKQEAKTAKRKELRGGVVATILKPGAGAAAMSRKRVQMKYVGTLASNGRKFDSGKIAFKLGAGEVIKGWDVGCLGMRVGERRTLFIPAKMAYGAAGAPPDIPRNADLNFDCVLLKA